MRKRSHMVLIGLAVPVLFAFGFAVARAPSFTVSTVRAQTTPTPEAPPFNQAAEIQKLRDAIKGRENEPAEKVFKNLQMNSMKAAPASRILAIMEMGYARSLGVNCTHCHVAGKWESDEKPQKDIAREMAGMAFRINNEILKNIKNLKGPTPTVNCTTCHRGEIKPALNLVPRS